jgi:hypothetical protein
MSPARLHSALLHAVTQYDIGQSKRKDYNKWALPRYIEAVNNICEDVKAGADLRKAITAALLGRLADTCLKAIGLDESTDSEARGNGSWYYQPVAAKASE